MGNKGYVGAASPKTRSGQGHRVDSFMSGLKGRRGVGLVLGLVGLISYLRLGTDQRTQLVQVIKNAAPIPLTKAPLEPETAPISVLRIPKPVKSSTPAVRFRDNLLEDERYIYANHAYGLSNQFIELCKVVTMGYRMGRTPIFDYMHAEHHEGSSPLVSEMFDFVPALNRLNMSMVEWADLKTTDPDLAEPEELSGWAAFGPYTMPDGLRNFNIATHFWPIPPVMAFYPTMTTIELLGQRPPWDWIEENGERVWVEQGKEMPGPPDEVVLTLDQTFFIREARIQQGRVEFWESLEHVDPDGFMWKEVGQHVKFQPWIESFATDFLGALFANTTLDGDIVPGSPPVTGAFIGVHLRQGDFGEHGRAVGETTLPELFHEAVLEVRDELVLKFGEDVAGNLPVLFATDSADAGWINLVEETYGWVYLNHSVWDREADEEHAGWLPGMLDSCVLGRALGLVGTHMSTFSSVAARRVESWQGGITRKVDPNEPKPEDTAEDESVSTDQQGAGDEEENEA